jgi:hypothetical protein
MMSAEDEVADDDLDGDNDEDVEEDNSAATAGTDLLLFSNAAFDVETWTL